MADIMTSPPAGLPGTLKRFPVTGVWLFRRQRRMRKFPWAVALIYTVVSLAVEAATMVIGHLQVPRDTAILAPVVLTVPPVLTAWISGYRRPRELVLTAVLLSVLTLVLTLFAGRLTGISSGMVEPVIVRTLAGLLAGTIAVRRIASIQ